MIDGASNLTRPIVTILIVATMCFIAIKSDLRITSDQFITIAAMIIAFWFGQRAAQPVTNIVPDRRADNENSTRGRSNPSSRPGNLPPAAT